MTFTGKNIKRKEDYRLLSGNSQFVADMQEPGMAEALFVRSEHAHAKLNKIDISKAENMGGVYSVIIAEHFNGEVDQLPPHSEFTLPQNLIDEINPIIQPCPEDILAKDRVIYVGQPIAIIVADNRYIAEDAAELIEIEYESLPSITDPYKAMEQDVDIIHEQMSSNIQAQFDLSTGNYDQALKDSDNVLKERIKTPRVAANPIETRGILSTYDSRNGKLQVWSSTQVTFMVRKYISKLLGLVEHNVRVVAPDVGGGFGSKCAVYPEEIIIPYLSMKLDRPVRWIEDRMEHLLSTRQSRDQTHDVKVSYNNDGTITGIQDYFVLDNGAYNPLVLTCSYNTAAHLRGVYDIPNFVIGGNCVVTNKAPTIAYRGAGRPEAVFVMDRIIHLVATSLELDPVEVMMKNMIKPEQLPYDSGLIYRDGEKVIYDSGDYPDGLKQALELANYDKFRKEQKKVKSDGSYVGIGISSYVEGTGIGPHEGAIVRLDSSGHVMAFVGSAPHGQSHETTLSQICADEFGLDPEKVTVKAGDTDLIPYGVGTFASRGAVTAGNAVHVASKKLQEKLLAIAGEILEISPSDLEMNDGKVFPRAMQNKYVTLEDLALAAKPGPKCKVPEGMEPGVEATHYFVPPTVTYSSGYHVAIVEVDEETGFVDILKYYVVHDAGKVLNPKIVDGQIQGGVAQGIGAALYEELVYDDNGQLLTGTYMDYLIPTAMEIPDVEMDHQEFLSTRNPMGVKGVGEGGTISPPAAITNAVCDALNPLDIKLNDLPISPSKLRQRIKVAKTS
ncbi:xanthine dehydrogenase family protein molybdopterin-binding subunit [Salicibibacter cibarius]|uniref:Xanthine dehydrogenase family protein molybdopterin-binding subunit n=1 Tax=Salicibibacter cibarius TaxID=2743000 RepID=A0A7T6Z108_9BACI|nr:xanthine dehydrogenase family protein molybdopterin-binding subunit [Salicibibacter cibarius]QQK74721.1 xanthine dehydrogenase family protein molybdopterin-binding subunit [Salicibibacter cibarius]